MIFDAYLWPLHCHLVSRKCRYTPHLPHLESFEENLAIQTLAIQRATSRPLLSQGAVSHKAPPLCVVIRLRAYGSHSLFNVPQPFGIVLVLPNVTSTRKFYSMARGTSIKKWSFSLAFFSYTPIHCIITHTLNLPNPKTMSHTGCGLNTTTLFASH